MYSIIDPALLFINQDDWNKNVEKLKFMENLMNMTRSIHENNIDICWGEELYDILWKSEQKPVWRELANQRNKYSTYFYRYLWNHLKPDLVSPSKTICKYTPDLNLTDAPDKFIVGTLKIAHAIIDKENKFYFLLGAPNHEVKNLKMSCDCLYEVFPACIRENSDWYKDDDFLINNLWPKKKDRFAKEYFIFLHKLDGTTKKFRYDISVSNNFIRTLERQDTQIKLDISRQIAYRLQLTNKEAGKNKSLNDEYIKQTKVHCFRTSRGARVIYDFKDDGHIIFLDYDPASQHNDHL